MVESHPNAKVTSLPSSSEIVWMPHQRLPSSIFVEYQQQSQEGAACKLAGAARLQIVTKYKVAL